MAAIDVLLPVRNGVAFLGEAIDSIRNQTFSDWRLLILDHGSNDGSMELSHKYADLEKRITVFSFPNAAGLAGLLNDGLERCDCRHVMRQDHDDISLPNRMETINTLFESNPGLLLAGGDAKVIDPVGNEIGYLRMPRSPAAFTAASFFYNPILHPAVSMSFAALNHLGARYGKDILNVLPASQSMTVHSLAEDYCLFGQLALLGPCVNINVPLIKYRRHGGSVGISNPIAQLELALQIARFLAKSFCIRKGLEVFDPGPFCNHADYVFDFRFGNYSARYAQMSDALRRGLGHSTELERELAFRWILATRSSAQMVRRYLQLEFQHSVTPTERRTVRNWLLRGVRNGKYVYRPDAHSSADENARERSAW